MLASVCGEGAFIFYFEMIFHAREKVVALKKLRFPFGLFCTVKRLFIEYFYVVLYLFSCT